MLSEAEVAHLRGFPLRKGVRNRLRLARSLARVTQVELGRQTKPRILQAQISAIERGSYSDMPVETARALATFFGCAIEDLFPAVGRVRQLKAS